MFSNMGITLYIFLSIANCIALTQFFNTQGLNTDGQFSYDSKKGNEEV